MKKMTPKEEYTSSKIKDTGTFKGKSNKLGGGGRFAQMEAKGMSPALVAYIGRKKYGAKKFGELSH